MHSPTHLFPSALLSIIFSILILFSTCSNGFEIREANIDQIQSAFNQNKLTSRELVEFYLKAIKELNPLLKAVIEVNPDALHQAEKADQERKSKRKGGLHGIPVLLKDNIATKDRLNTTAGSLALLGSVVPRDAGVVSRLRKAGAIILGKASLSEWAHFRAFSAPSGWCARGGQAKNPYVLSEDPCGSSTGSAVAVAANMVTVSLGTETDGSILCPSSANSVVGIKPTLGLTSRAGVIPITPRQDTVGKGGATMVDNLEISKIEISHFDPSAETTAMLHEFKRSLNNYLSELLYSPVRSLSDVIAFNEEHPIQERMEDIGQSIFLAAENTTSPSEEETRAVHSLRRLSRHGYEKLMKENTLDALVTPRSSASSVLAIGGYPGISVPAGYEKIGVPFGICFGGLRGSEPKLIEIAFAFEQATKIRKPPSFI